MKSGHCASCAGSAFVFATERGGPFTTDAVNRLIKRIGARAGLGFPVHCHMLRHACGYALANAGHDTRALQDWLGHRNIQHTVRVYRAVADTVQGLLALLTGSVGQVLLTSDQGRRGRRCVCDKSP